MKKRTCSNFSNLVFVLFDSAQEYKNEAEPEGQYCLCLLSYHGVTTDPEVFLVFGLRMQILPIARNQVSIYSPSRIFSFGLSTPYHLLSSLCQLPPWHTHLFSSPYFSLFSSPGFIWLPHEDTSSVSISSWDTMLMSLRLMPLVSSGWIKAVPQSFISILWSVSKFSPH